MLRRGHVGCPDRYQHPSRVVREPLLQLLVRGLPGELLPCRRPELHPPLQDPRAAPASEALGVPVALLPDAGETGGRDGHRARRVVRDCRHIRVRGVHRLEQPGGDHRPGYRQQSDRNDRRRALQGRHVGKHADLHKRVGGHLAGRQVREPRLHGQGRPRHGDAALQTPDGSCGLRREQRLRAQLRPHRPVPGHRRLPDDVRVAGGAVQGRPEGVWQGRRGLQGAAPDHTVGRGSVPGPLPAAHRCGAAD
mmetsp:Transcript_96381/g.251169  ORF Transcript_96381/g.251169 Transcript_96381/m.251169 type:complete len:250 (+) Transcript_96381:391-1140(+)